MYVFFSNCDRQQQEALSGVFALKYTQSFILINNRITSIEVVELDSFVVNMHVVTVVYSFCFVLYLPATTLQNKFYKVFEFIFTRVFTYVDTLGAKKRIAETM